MKKLVLWIPIIGAILIFMDTYYDFNLLSYKYYPEGIKAILLAPYHGVVTGFPISMLIINIFFK